MKRKTLIIVVVLAMLFGFTQTIMASIPNHFRTTDGDSDIINDNMYGKGLANGWYFGVYDYNGDPSSGLDLLLGSSSTSLESAQFEVHFNSNDNNYYINVKTGVDELKSSINIGTSDDFSFYFRNGSNYDTDFTIKSGGGDAYSFTSNKNGGNIVGDDLSTVSIPNSMILLFSGLLGLITFDNRKKAIK